MYVLESIYVCIVLKEIEIEVIFQQTALFFFSVGLKESSILELSGKQK